MPLVSSSSSRRHPTRDRAIDGTAAGRSRAVPSRGTRGLGNSVPSDPVRSEALVLDRAVLRLGGGGPELLVDLLHHVAVEVRADGDVAGVDELAFHLGLAVEHL